jgi:hypothetical protein
VKIPALDPSKAEEFLKYVLRQRVEKFINLAKGPQPQKMLLTDNALEIEILVANETKPITLTVGGETPDQGFWFAKSSVLPDEYFTLRKNDRQPADQTTDLFEKLRSKTPVEFFNKPLPK